MSSFVPERNTMTSLVNLEYAQRLLLRCIAHTTEKAMSTYHEPTPEEHELDRALVALAVTNIEVAGKILDEERRRG